MNNQLSTDNLATICARLSLIEFALEIEIGNKLADRSEDETKFFARNFVERAGKAELGPPPQTSEDEQLEALTAEKLKAEAERLAKRICIRSQSIREFRKVLGDNYPL